MPRAYEAPQSKFSDIAKRNYACEKSADGCYIVETGDEFAVNKYIALIRGKSIIYPSIERVYSIASDSAAKIELISRGLIDDEKKYGAPSVGIVESHDRHRLVELYKRQDSPDYYQYAEEYAQRNSGGQSSRSAGASGRSGNGRGSAGSGKASSKVKYSLREDSAGNALTEKQQEYFADSKVRDENGRLKIMYHGAANDFTVFNPMLHGGKNGTAEGHGIYFTDTASITTNSKS